MVSGDLKSRVDKIWDTMWAGGIANPLAVIKRLDELHTLKERKAQRLGQPIEEPIFALDQDVLRWSLGRSGRQSPRPRWC